MKILKTVLIVLASIVVLAVIGIALLPSERTVERSVVVATSADKPFKLVNNLTNWTKWSPWYMEDTTSKMEYSENPEGLGAWYTWDSKNKNLGKGKLTIINSAKPDSIIVQLEFADWPPNTAAYRFEKISDTETKVTQSMELKADGFFMKAMIMLMSGALGNQFETGLANIKKVAEEMPDEPEVQGKTENLVVEEMPGMMYLAYTDSTTVAGISDLLKRAYGEIMVQAGIQGLEQAGAPFAVYETWDPENDRVIIRAGIPVNKEGKSEGNVKYIKTEVQKVASVDFFGPYENSGMGHEAMDAYIQANGLTIVGAPYEFYMNDPSTVTNPMEIHTKISYPVMEGDMEANTEEGENAEG